MLQEKPNKIEVRSQNSADQSNPLFWRKKFDPGGSTSCLKGLKWSSAYIFLPDITPNIWGSMVYLKTKGTNEPKNICFCLTHRWICMDHYEVTKISHLFPIYKHSWPPSVQPNLDVSIIHFLESQSSRTTDWFLIWFLILLLLLLDDLILQSTDYMLYLVSQIQAESRWRKQTDPYDSLHSVVA